VIQALYQAGANAMILISKADLFSVTGRERMIEYVKTNLRIQLQVKASVHAVSVLGANAALCDCWFESELRPFLAQHHELAIASQKRKIGGLREAVIGALERRLHAGSEGISIEQVPQPSETIEALRNAFTAFADRHRAHFNTAAVRGLSDISALQNDLRVLREWEPGDQEAQPVIGRA
jgi:hypothetical protein